MKISTKGIPLILVWILMLLTMVVNNDIFTYCAFVISGVGIIIGGKKGGFVFRKYQIRINICFLIILTSEIIGLFQKYSLGNMRGIIAVIAIMILFNSTIFAFYSDKKHKLMLIMYYVTLLYIFISKTFIKFGNSLSGSMIFFFLGAMYLLIENNRYIRNKSKEYFIAMIAFLATGYSAYQAGARTALITLLIVNVLFIVLYKKKIFNSNKQYGFYIILGIVFFLISIYANITTFEWYTKLNEYSVSLFGKNIDSSRPLLWKNGVEAAKQNILIGIGTGARPSDIGMSWDSFHNSFIQIFVQNGLLALIPTIYIFKTIWGKLRNNIEDKSVKFLMACFIGIIVYNCFEVTLLNNKVSLGVIQWFLLAIACAKCDILEDYKKEISIL